MMIWINEYGKDQLNIESWNTLAAKWMNLENFELEKLTNETQGLTESQDICVIDTQWKL